jgi:hypothetical protein
MEARMSEQIFPSWWGPQGGDPIQCRNPQEIAEGWVEHRGRYDFQIGQWVPEGARRGARPRRRPGLTRKRRAVLVAIAAAEGAAHAPRARRRDLIAAIRAKRAGAPAA